ncbi:MAG: hypothetical protein KJO98_14405, partial [Rhodothermia bacterium]|nr:hypothetical protein [Rhodothermia bacterium]
AYGETSDADHGDRDDDFENPFSPPKHHNAEETNAEAKLHSSPDPGASKSTDKKGGREYEPGVARRFRFEPIRPEAPRRSPPEDSEGEALKPTASAGAKRRTEISTAVRDFREPEPQKGLIIPPNRVKTIALIVLVVAITVSAAILAFRLSTNSTPAESSSSEIGIPSGDPTALVQAQPAAVEPVVPLPVIGDTIVVTLIADGRPLDPVRVRVDSDLRRPYWINTGDSLSFAMTSQIVIDSLLHATVVKLEGVEYPRDAYRARSSVVITRDSVVRFVESLAAR